MIGRHVENHVPRFTKCGCQCQRPANEDTEYGRGNESLVPRPSPAGNAYGSDADQHSDASSDRSDNRGVASPFLRCTPNGDAPDSLSRDRPRRPVSLDERDATDGGRSKLPLHRHAPGRSGILVEPDQNSLAWLHRHDPCPVGHDRIGMQDPAEQHQRCERCQAESHAVTVSEATIRLCGWPPGVLTCLHDTAQGTDRISALAGIPLSALVRAVKGGEPSNRFNPADGTLNLPSSFALPQTSHRREVRTLHGAGPFACGADGTARPQRSRKTHTRDRAGTAEGEALALRCTSRQRTAQSADELVATDPQSAQVAQHAQCDAIPMEPSVGQVLNVARSHRASTSSRERIRP